MQYVSSHSNVLPFVTYIQSTSLVFDVINRGLFHLAPRPRQVAGRALESLEGLTAPVTR